MPPDSRSGAGSRFVERILTVVATCRQHDRPILAYLTEVCEAMLHAPDATHLRAPAISPEYLTRRQPDDEPHRALPSSGPHPVVGA